MSKKSDRKRKAIQKKKREEEKPSSRIARPNWGKEFLKWRKERPQKLINELKEMGYLKNESDRDVRESEESHIRDVSKDKDTTS